MKELSLNIEQAVGLLDDTVQEYGADHVYTPVPPRWDEDEPMGEECSYVHTAEQQNSLARLFRVAGMPDAPAEVPDDAPPVCGCLIGAALVRHGVPMAELVNRYGDVIFVLDELNRAGVLRVEPGVKGLFVTAQEHQDRGRPWGEAVELAKDRAGLR